MVFLFGAGVTEQGFFYRLHAFLTPNTVKAREAAQKALLLFYLFFSHKQSVKQRLQRLLIWCREWTGVETERLFLWRPGYYYFLVPKASTIPRARKKIG